MKGLEIQALFFNGSRSGVLPAREPSFREE
jgi:hypothetical protein